MGKFLKPLDIESETTKVLTAVRKYIKTAGCNVGNVDHDIFVGNRVVIIVDNDGKLASDIGSMLGKLKNVSVIETLEYQGSYDWSSDTYARPASSILIAFKQ